MVLHGFCETDEATTLTFALPVSNIFQVTTTTEVDVLASADEHIRGSYDISNGVFSWIIPGDPDRDWDIISGVTIGDWENAMKTEQQLGPSIVVSVDIGLWTNLGKCFEKSVGVGINGEGV